MNPEQLFGPIWPIRPVGWPRRSGREPASPFHPASKRPLRLTLHGESFSGTGDLESLALTSIDELAHMPQVEVVSTQAGKHPQMVIEPEDGSGFRPVRLDRHDGTGVRTGFKVQGPTGRLPREEAQIALAHLALRNDLLVTASPTLLGVSETDRTIKEANAMPPSAAARLLGLLLRSRHDYHFTGYAPMDGGYHFYLMRYVLRSFWGYHGATSSASSAAYGGASSLTSSIMKRAERALEARDSIACTFHGGAPGATRQMEYHFDYLMLLLSGALDAQAKITAIAYDLDARIPKNICNFRNKQLMDGIGGADAALAKRIKANLPLIKVIAALRNTIHGVGLGGARVNVMSADGFHLEVPPDIEAEFTALIEGTPARDWGVGPRSKLLFLPVVFADSAVREVFRVLDQIAAATRLDRFLANRSPRARLHDVPPDAGGFGDDVGQRLLAIGW